MEIFDTMDELVGNINDLLDFVVEDKDETENTITHNPCYGNSYKEQDESDLADAILGLCEQYPDYATYYQTQYRLERQAVIDEHYEKTLVKIKKNPDLEVIDLIEDERNERVHDMAFFMDAHKITNPFGEDTTHVIFLDGGWEEAKNPELEKAIDHIKHLETINPSEPSAKELLNRMNFGKEFKLFKLTKDPVVKQKMNKTLEARIVVNSKNAVVNALHAIAAAGKIESNTIDPNFDLVYMAVNNRSYFKDFTETTHGVNAYVNSVEDLSDWMKVIHKIPKEDNVDDAEGHLDRVATKFPIKPEEGATRYQAKAYVFSHYTVLGLKKVANE